MLATGLIPRTTTDMGWKTNRSFTIIKVSK